MIKKREKEEENERKKRREVNILLCNPPNKVPLNIPRQQLGLLDQFLSIILSEMALAFVVQGLDIRSGFEFGDGY